MPNPITGDPNARDISQFANGLTGTCLCGAVRVTIHDDELFTKRRGHLCHCENCRKVSGSHVAPNIVIESDKVEIQDTEGTLKTYTDYATTSGVPIVRYFCARDGSPINSTSENLPGMFVVKLGLFPRIPVPEMETFALHRHPWEPAVEGTVKFKLGFGGEVIEENEGYSSI